MPASLYLLFLTQDAVDLLEKRVKSRFSERVIHCILPQSYDSFLERALDSLLEPEEEEEAEANGSGSAPAYSSALPSEWAEQAHEWNEQCRSMVDAPDVKLALQHEWELHNDVRRIHHAWVSASKMRQCLV